MSPETSPSPSSPDPSTGEPDRLRAAREFWERSAQEDHRRAIWDDEALAREEGVAAFEEAGRREAERLTWFVPPGSTVLDLGCGSGRVMLPLAPRCREIIGLDISPTMIAEAARTLEGTPNARLHLTGGASLEPVEDASIDVVYALLVLIHVDKRSAFRYLREMRRVLRPGGTAHLQFLNILSDEGLAEFERVVDLDEHYPLELYAPDEVRGLAGRAGLELLSKREIGRWIYATLLNGSAADWRAATARGVRLEHGPGGGSAPRPGSLLPRTGRLELQVASELEEPRPFLLQTALYEPGEGAPRFHFAAEHTLVARPGASHALSIDYSIEEREVEVRGAEDLVALPPVELGPPPATSRAVLAVGLLPPGFERDEAIVAFPGLHLVADVSIAD